MQKLRKDLKTMVFQGNTSCRNMILRESSPIDSFHMESVTGSHDGLESVSFVNPLQMLFNQMRLDNLGEQSLRMWLEGQPEDSAISSLMKQCSPEDIMCTLKSRYLQQPCEIRAWAEYMSHNMEKFNAEVKSVLDAQKKESQHTEPVTNPNTE